MGLKALIIVGAGLIALGFGIVLGFLSHRDDPPNKSKPSVQINEEDDL
jgi:hypothetical protein